MEILRIDGYIGQGAGIESIFGGGEGFSLKMLNEFLDKLPPSEKELTVEINSGGGQVSEGFAIHDRLVSSGLDITTEVIGTCGSIATIIACAAPLERRIGYENAKYYIHNPYFESMHPVSMTKDDAKKLYEDLEDTEEDILNFYVKATGSDKEDIKQYMVKGSNLSMREAKRLGFIGKIINKKVSARAYAVYAFINPVTMANKDFTPEQKSWFTKQLESLLENKLFAKKKEEVKDEIVNEVMQLADGGSISVDGALEAGTAVFTVDADGNPTTEPAPDGEYTLADGTKITVAAGAITAVTEAETEVEALKKQVEDLTAQLKDAQDKAAEVVNEKEETEKQVVAMKKEITDFKNMILGNPIPPKQQNFKAEPEEKKSMAQQLKEFRDKKQNKN